MLVPTTWLGSLSTPALVAMRMKALPLLALVLLAAPVTAQDRLYFDGEALVFEAPLTAGERQVARAAAAPEHGWVFAWTYTFRAAGNVSPDFTLLHYASAPYAVTLPILPNPEASADEATCSRGVEIRIKGGLWHECGNGASIAGPSGRHGVFLNWGAGHTVPVVPGDVLEMTFRTSTTSPDGKPPVFETGVDDSFLNLTGSMEGVVVEASSGVPAAATAEPAVGASPPDSAMSPRQPAPAAPAAPLAGMLAVLALCAISRRGARRPCTDH